MTMSLCYLGLGNLDFYTTDLAPPSTAEACHSCASRFADGGGCAPLRRGDTGAASKLLPADCHLCHRHVAN